MNKPVKPNETLPSSFGGVKENFSASKISSGYQKNIRDILGGANLNYLLDVIGKKDIYHDSITDYINALPINKTIMTDANNNLVYTQYDIRVYDATETYYKDDYVTGYDNDNEKYIYKSLVNNNLNHPVTDNDYWAKVSIIGNGFVRNIGEVVTSVLPLNDSGLHLLDGALIQGTGIYTAFVNYIATLYGDGTNVPAYFTSEANWQSTVATYGVCGKFVYNSTNNTVRFPKVTGLIEGTIDLNALGDLVEAGLPNITGQFYSTDDNGASTTNGAFRAYTSTSASGTGGTSPEKLITFDASLSSAIYNNSITVQPQTIKAFIYIVIATSAKTDIQVDIDDIATDLNGKADTDLSNVPNSKGILVERFVNGSSWYRVYSDGWCEQGDYLGDTTFNTKTVTLLKTYADTNFTITTAIKSTSNSAGIRVEIDSTSQIYFTRVGSTNVTGWWRTSGYLATT